MSQHNTKPTYSKLPTAVIDGVRKYEIQPGVWVSRQRVSQIRKGAAIQVRPTSIQVKQLRETQTTNRLLAALLIQLANIQARRSVADLVDLLAPTGLSFHAIAAALGTSDAVVNVSVSRRRPRRPSVTDTTGGIIQ